MPRVNPRNNATMQRVQAPAPVIVKPPPPKVKTSTAKRPTREPYNPRPNPPQIRNVTQPVKKQTGWCNCEFWDVGCKAGCLAQEQIVDPVVSGTQWLAGGADVHITQPIVSGGEWLAGGAEVHVTQPLTDAWIETEKFFGGVATEIEKTQDEIDKVAKDLADAGGATITWLTESIGGTADWTGDMMAEGKKFVSGASNMAGGLGSMMGNMMRGMGNIANVGSSSFGWIKWVLIAIGALIAGFIAWRVLK